MKKISKILLPIDLGETSKEAGQYALMLAHKFDCPLRVLHVVNTVEYAVYAPQFSWPVPVMIEDIENSAKQKMRDFIKGLGSEELITTHVESTTMNVATTICEDAKNNAVDLIVMSTHGRKGMERFILGSVAERVARIAPCPVLLVRSA